ncbi:MAG: GNAT family N-acetyltransferase, partial [Microthrixaceae bacterium]|nr:GNAT family N-acetyltransferase [Microthrixaceae bacterium]
MSRADGSDPPLEVRRATSSDLPHVLELVRNAHRLQLQQRDGRVWSVADAPLVDEARLHERLGDGLVLLGTVLGVPVGVAVVRHQPVEGGRLAVIEEIFTEPEARRVGVGRRLIEQVERWAVETGCLGIDSVALPGDR